jgi:REP element-mobilizing transposase RayT
MLPKRKSIRLKGYDYTQAGMYFITFCCQNRKHFFGKIVNKELQLNEAGKMIEKWYLELENKFPDVTCGEFVVMPNHFHCIIIKNEQPVGVDLRVHPNGNNMGEHHIAGGNKIDVHHIAGGNNIEGELIGSPLHLVVGWFKTMTTNEYIRGVKTLGWERFDGKLWQRNYWEHIIRNEKSFYSISEYIKNNPANWVSDRLK